VECVLESWLASKGFAGGRALVRLACPGRLASDVRRRSRPRLHARQQALELARALKRRLEFSHDGFKTIRGRSRPSELTIRATLEFFFSLERDITQSESSTFGFPTSRPFSPSPWLPATTTPSACLPYTTYVGCILARAPRLRSLSLHLSTELPKRVISSFSRLEQLTDLAVEPCRDEIHSLL
jgi:hypothetical protein